MTNKSALSIRGVGRPINAQGRLLIIENVQVDGDRYIVHCVNNRFITTGSLRLNCSSKTDYA